MVHEENTHLIKIPYNVKSFNNLMHVAVHCFKCKSCYNSYRTYFIKYFYLIYTPLYLYRLKNNKVHIQILSFLFLKGYQVNARNVYCSVT